MCQDMVQRSVSLFSFGLKSWILDYLVHVAVNDGALKRERRGEQMADSLCPRRRTTIVFTLCIGWGVSLLCCAYILSSKDKVD